ncbi:MAG: sulfatase [Acidobacteria bacterium]|nr:sulfatase [Acidobacteriota bacterium]
MSQRSPKGAGPCAGPSPFAQWPVLAGVGILHFGVLATGFFLTVPALGLSLGQIAAFALFLALFVLAEASLLVLVDGAFERALGALPRNRLLDVAKALVLGLALFLPALSLFKFLTLRSHLRFSDLWFALANAPQLLQESLRAEVKVALTVVVAFPLLLVGLYLALRRMRRMPPLEGASLRSFGLLLLLGTAGAAIAYARYEAVPVFARFLVPEIHWLGRLAGRAADGLAAEPARIAHFDLAPRPMEPWEPTPPAGGEELPNVVLVMLESVPWTRLGIGGGRPEATPHLDRLASESVVFSKAYTPSVHSDYAQMAILSSLYPRKYDRHDYYTDLSYPRTLIWDLLRPAGWRTSMFSCQNEHWGNMLAYLATPDLEVVRHSPDWPEAPRRGRGSESKVYEETVVGAWRQWLEEERPERYFTYLNFQATHFPYAIPDGEPTSFSPWQLDFPASFFRYPPDKVPVMLNRFDNALAYSDRWVGEVVSTLKERGEWERTILVVVSDHGEAFYQHGQPTHGTSFFEEQVRSVWMMRIPGQEPRLVAEPVSLLDLAPAVLSALGLGAHGGFQGRGDVLDLEYRAAGRPLFFTLQGVTFEDGVLLDGGKYSFNWDHHAHRFYDLRADPGETRNLAVSQPQVLNRHRDLVVELLTAQRAYYRDRLWEKGLYPPALP